MSDAFISETPTLELQPDQLVDWLRLIRSENVGPVTFRKLLNRYGNAGAALEALPHLSQRGGGQTPKIMTRREAENEIDAVERAGAMLVTPHAPHYPRLLRYIDSPPPVLTMLGAPPPARQKCVAIVGSRNASAAGRRMTRDIARALGEAGYHVVSGLARGIDAAAHEAALHTGTSAVLAGGINRLYPPEHGELLQALAKHGAALTEMPFNWQATARCFPRRNRIVAGMCLATVVVEAAERSGSLITARLANEQGREVFALPGSPLDPRASGTNRLIKQGAQMVTSADDILDALAQMPDEPPQAQLPAREDEMFFSFEEEDEPAVDERAQIIAALGTAPVTVDMLIQETGLPSARVHAILLELELAGRIEAQGGQRVALMSADDEKWGVA